MLSNEEASVYLEDIKPGVKSGGDILERLKSVIDTCDFVFARLMSWIVADRPISSSVSL